MKKSLIIILAVIAVVLIIGFIGYGRLTGFAVYSPNKIKINVVNDNLNPGENLVFSVDVFDEKNIPIKTEIDILIEDANKKTKIERRVSSGESTSIPLDEKADFGYWKITASYKDSSNEIVQDVFLFNVEIQEGVRFDIEGDVLTIENTGNSLYERTIQIVIGNVIGTKNVRLDIGEKAEVRLTAPDGAYNIKITDGKTSYTKSSVELTGNVVGVLDTNIASSPITGINPEKGSSFVFKKKSIIYLFLAAIIGAAILLAIEKNYRKKIES